MAPEVVVGIVGILVAALWQPAIKPVLKRLLRRAGVPGEPDTGPGVSRELDADADVFELPGYHPIPQLAPVQHPDQGRHPEALAELP